MGRVFHDCNMAARDAPLDAEQIRGRLRGPAWLAWFTAATFASKGAVGARGPAPLGAAPAPAAPLVGLGSWLRGISGAWECVLVVLRPLSAVFRSSSP